MLFEMHQWHKKYVTIIWQFLLCRKAAKRLMYTLLLNSHPSRTIEEIFLALSAEIEPHVGYLENYSTSELLIMKFVKTYTRHLTIFSSIVYYSIQGLLNSVLFSTWNTIFITIALLQARYHACFLYASHFWAWFSLRHAQIKLNAVQVWKFFAVNLQHT